jgi:hypothetical protein
MTDTQRTPAVEGLVAELLALDAKATPAPWRINDDPKRQEDIEAGDVGSRLWMACELQGTNYDENRDLIVALRNALPVLADALTAKDAEIAGLRRALQRIANVCKPGSLDWEDVDIGKVVADALAANEGGRP